METVGTFSQPFFEWLLRSTLQASIIVCLIFLIQAAVRNRLTARWHYALWLILVVRMILPWAPQSRFSIYNLAAWQGKPAVPAHITPEQDAEPSPASRQPADTQGTPAGSKPADTAEGQGRTTPDPVATSRANTHSTARAEFARVTVLPLIWLGGMLFLGGYIIISNLRLWRAASVECPSTDRDTLELLEECRTTIGLRTIVALVPSKTVNTPVLLGFVRPRLLVPKDITEKLTREELRYVFLHELAHVKRHDIALGWLTTLLQLLHWFNPLVWLAFHRMRSNRESACDALVLSRTRGEAAQDYGLAIVSLLEHFSVPQALPGLAGILESKSQLKRRIAMITQFDNKSYRWSPLSAVLIIILACISVPDGTRAKASEPFDPASAITIRQVWSDWRVGGIGAISPCGRYLALRDWATDNLAIRELATGTEHILAAASIKNGEVEWKVLGSMVFSPDSSRIVYAWINNESAVDLRIIGLNEPEPQVLLNPKSNIWMFPVAWSPDGKNILTEEFYVNSDRTQYALVSVSDGSYRIIQSLTEKMVDNVAGFSLDGKYVVYSSPQETGSASSDIFLLALDSGIHSPIVEHPANDRALDWTPDGRGILFTSDRRGTRDAWLIQVADGKPQGEPRLVKSDMGRMQPLGFTQNGSYYCTISSWPADVYIAAVDLEAGKVIEPPKKVSLRREGSSISPDWSPDGGYLAYISQTFAETGDLAKIVIHSLETGEYRELSTSLQYVRPMIHWSPDGRSFVVWGTKGPGNTSGIYRIDAQTGEQSLIKQGYDRQPKWTPDGKGIVYLEYPDGNDSGIGRILLRDLETGWEQEIGVPVNGIEESVIALSPDGRQMAFTVFDEETKSMILNVVPIAGGKPRELTRMPRKDRFADLEWTPDGSHVLFQKHLGGGKIALWRVPAEGGTPRPSGLIATGWGGRLSSRMHPDGRRVAFVGGAPMMGEVWVMENLLPMAKAAN